MPPAHAQDFRPQLDAHEERLQRVESNSEETRVKVAEIATKIDHYEEMSVQSRADIAQKIEQGFERLSDDQRSLLRKLEEHAKEEHIERVAINAQLLDHQQKIDKTAQWVAEADARRVARWSTAKKLGITILLAGLGVLGTKLAETIIIRMGIH